MFTYIVWAQEMGLPSRLRKINALRVSYNLSEMDPMKAFLLVTFQKKQDDWDPTWAEGEDADISKQTTPIRDPRPGLYRLKLSILTCSCLVLNSVF